MPRNQGSACAAGISGQSLDPVYPRLWDNDNHCRKAPRRRARQPQRRDKARGSRNTHGIDPRPGTGMQPRCQGIKKAGAIPGSWNEGVGEHVRTRSRPMADEALGETAERRPLRTERRKTVSSAVPILKPRGSSDPAVDLMSRRHPLSSTRALQGKTGFRRSVAGRLS